MTVPTPHPQMLPPRHRRIAMRLFLGVALLILFGATGWILSLNNVISGLWASIFSAAFAVLGVLLPLVQGHIQSSSELAPPISHYLGSKRIQAYRQIYIEDGKLGVNRQKGAMVIYTGKRLRGSTISLCKGFHTSLVNVVEATNVVERIINGAQVFAGIFPALEPGNYIFRLLGETEHQSCLLLTSREKPKEMVRMEGNSSRVRALPLSGISQGDGQQLFKERNLSGSPGDWAKLISIYSGNPLVLKFVAEKIQELFNGDIAEFLAEDEIVFGDIQDLIAQQVQRLTLPEKQILYSLAIEREPISRPDLLENMRHTYPKSAVLLEALDSLRRRSLVEIGEPKSGSKSYPCFTLQPMIREYITVYFVEQASQTIVEEELTPTQDVEISLETTPLSIGSEGQKKEKSAARAQIAEDREFSSLKEARLEHGWTQVELAAMIGVSDRAYRAWENGDAYPSDLLLRCLTKVFGKEPGELGLEKRPKTSLT